MLVSTYIAGLNEQDLHNVAWSHGAPKFGELYTLPSKSALFRDFKKIKGLY